MVQPGRAGRPVAAEPPPPGRKARRMLCRPPMGKILLGVIIGVILVIWLLASCVGNLF